MANFFRRFFGILALFIISFCFAKFSYAYYDNFDSYASSTLVDTLDYFTSVSANNVVSTNFSTSSPNSLKFVTDAFLKLNTSDILYSLSFSVMFQDATFGIYDQNTSQYVVSLYLDKNASDGHGDIYLDSTASLPVQLASSGTIADNEWVQISLLFDYEARLIQGKINNNSFSAATSTTNYPPNGFVISGISGSYPIYFDNLYFLTTDDYYSDNINFINPADSSISTIGDFYWEYQFNIATSSYWTTYSYLNVDLGIFHTTSGIVDSTTTLSIYRYPMSDFVPMTTYDVIQDDPLSFPDRTGAYYAVISLKGIYSNGSSDSLAYDTAIFGIATSTSGYNPSAWCSGLCNDLASSSSASWWEIWDWDVDNLGGTLLCAGRYTVCYAVQPHSFSTGMFNDIYEDFKTVFPFNTFFEIASTTKNAFASSTMSSNQTFGVPMLSTTSDFYILPVISSSSLPDFIGDSNANIFRTTISYLLYFFTAGIIFLILW